MSQVWSDQELVDALLRNDEQAIVYFFYTKYYATFEYHIFKIFKYEVDVQALVHEILLYLCANNWKHLRTFNPENSKLTTWVSVISFRFFMNFKKSKIDSYGLISIQEEWDDRILLSQQSNQEHVRMDVNKAIGSLKNEKEQLVARRLLLEGAEIQDVAAENGMTVDYAYTVKSRAIGHLRNLLKSYRS